MYTPHAMTWYEQQIGTTTTYTRHEILGVMWQAVKAANTARVGLTEADKAAVYVPFVDGKPIGVKIGDYLIQGIVPDELTSATISATMKKYPSMVKVVSVDVKGYGTPGMQHVQIGGR